jgi:hypothetical protein
MVKKSSGLPVVPGALVVEAFAAAALPALGLGQGNQVGLWMGVPETAVRGQVLKKGADALLAVADGVSTEHYDGFGASGLNRALEPLAVHGQMGPVHAVGHEAIVAVSFEALALRDSTFQRAVSEEGLKPMADKLKLEAIGLPVSHAKVRATGGNAP